MNLFVFQKELSNEAALSYLDHYGYLTIASSVRNFSLFDSFADSLRSFQKYFGLSPSGVLDAETSRAMKRPRYGYCCRRQSEGLISDSDSFKDES